MLILLVGVCSAGHGLGSRADARADGNTADRWTLLAVPASEATAGRLAGLPVLVEGGTASELHLEARAWALPLLDQAGISYRVLEEDMALLRPRPSPGREVDYRDPTAMEQTLRALALEYPDITRVVQVGTSWQERPITGLVVTDQPLTRELDEPSLRLLGTHHGDEWSSMEVTLALAEHLTSHYDTDEDVQQLIDQHELWIVPVVNPDGAEAFTRNNSRDVDLNRNYGYLWEPGPYAGEAPFSEVEAAAIRALSMLRSFGHSVSLHSGATNLGWVWNHQTEPAADEAWMEELATSYLLATDQPDFWVTNGADWYISHGDTNDWSYGIRGGHDYTLEVSLQKTPPAEQIPTFVGYHVGPTVGFLTEASRAGIRGRVRDEDGAGIEASILPLESPWPTWTDPETGAFARPLLPGDYTLQVEAPGFVTSTETVTVAEPGDHGESLDIEITLTPRTEPGALSLSSLEHSVTTATDLEWCGDSVVDAVAEGGQVGLDRPGTEGPHWLDIQEEGPCIHVTVDPERIPNAWQREGEWHLVVGDSEGSILESHQLAVLLSSDLPGYTLQAVELEALDDLGTAVVHVLGQTLPEGSMLRFVGPSGQRVMPALRLAGDEPNRIAAQVDASSWEDGSWSVRVFGNGHWSALPGALEAQDGIISQPSGPKPEPEAEPPDSAGWNYTALSPDDVADDDDIASASNEDLPDGSGCSCSTTPPGRTHSSLWLALLLGIRYSRVRLRRRKPCTPFDVA